MEAGAGEVGGGGGGEWFGDQTNPLWRKQDASALS